MNQTVDALRPWLQSYPQNVPAEINFSQYRSLVDVLQEAVQKFTTDNAYHSLGVNMTYAELDQKSMAFARYLASCGCTQGTRVALMMPNVLQYPVALFGALRAGCTVVNCNPLYTAPELQHQLIDSGAQVIVILENFATTLQKVLPHTAIKQVVVTSMGEMLGGLKGMVVNFVVRKVKKLVPEWNIAGALNFRQAVQQGHSFAGFDAQAVRNTLSQDDIAFLQYTGGTTGVAKGAMLTHGNMLANLTQAKTWVQPPVSSGKEIILTALPLYHIFSLTANCLTFMQFGACNVLVANPRDIPALIKTLAAHKFTAMTGVNTLFNALLNHPDFVKLDFSTWRVALGGGAAVLPVVAKKWQQVTGCPLAQAYGLTETSPAATMNPLDGRAVIGSIGLPISSTELSIRDDAGKPCPQGEVGEICIRGPQVMKGYWNRPDETAKVFYDDGFLKTGDLGYVNEQGFVFLVDRKKDMLIVSGFNVYPNEVEEAVALHPGVLEVAAIGVPDEHSGEVVKIFVVKKDPNLSKEDLLAFCRTQLTAYKVPKHIEFRNELPKTNVGKILRRALRDEVVR